MIASIAIKNPTIQITVPLNEIVEFITPVIPLITARTINPKHITKAILDLVVYFFIYITLSLVKLGFNYPILKNH